MYAELWYSLQNWDFLQKCSSEDETVQTKHIAYSSHVLQYSIVERPKGAKLTPTCL